MSRKSRSNASNGYGLFGGAGLTPDQDKFVSGYRKLDKVTTAKRVISASLQAWSKGHAKNQESLSFFLAKYDDGLIDEDERFSDIRSLIEGFNKAFGEAVVVDAINAMVNEKRESEAREVEASSKMISAVAT